MSTTPSDNPIAPPRPSRMLYSDLTYNVARVCLVACPLMLIIPPRKLDWHSFGLCAAWLFSANQVSQHRSGWSILEKMHAHGLWSVVVGDVERGESAAAVGGRDGPSGKLRREKFGLGVAGEARARPAMGENEVAEARGGREVLQRVQMVEHEKQDWMEERLKREREALSQGRGYSGLIMDQIWEVWNWGKTAKDGEQGPHPESARGHTSSNGASRDDTR